MWLQPDWLFRWTQLYQRHKNCIDVLHGFSYRVIAERKQQIADRERQLRNDHNNNTTASNPAPAAPDADADIGTKRRLAFLDLLIQASQGGAVLSNEDIREEVDTFMFEGHDTTSAAVSWSLFLLGENPQIQERVWQEIDDVMGGDRERAPSMKELHEMRYLECVIKEALRLFPSVPLIARKIKEDVQIGECRVPLRNVLNHRPLRVYQ